MQAWHLGHWYLSSKDASYDGSSATWAYKDPYQDISVSTAPLLHSVSLKCPIASVHGTPWKLYVENLNPSKMYILTTFTVRWLWRSLMIFCADLIILDITCKFRKRGHPVNGTLLKTSKHKLHYWSPFSGYSNVLLIFRQAVRNSFAGSCRSTSAKPAVRRSPQQRTSQVHQTGNRNFKDISNLSTNY